ncbi:transglutaminase family protein [Acidimicrobiales bacterium]|jgi:transglutaminase-like putative cysteine protease|nr:transglutaminase family protein [Acidimicrobiaceae bacterium]MBT7430325.1 transglutaminase family protein [Ilumatobacter sp.]MCH9803888.1 transglutaminase family protein [bacterium]MDB9845289.1 transglutaminase family protein [Acidimicrobiales bacterium]
MTEPLDPAWLAPTWFIDSDSDEVAEFAATARATAADDNDHTDVAVALFYAVRDGFRYDPYVRAEGPEDYRASSVAGTAANWCTPKSVLLTAAARHCGIPARLGFADVRNHLSSEKLAAKMGTDLFIWHGYTEFLLDGTWRKASSAFNIEMCERFGVKALDFDGTTDSLMHPFDEAGARHMEYVNQRGSFNDLPLDEIQADFDRVYGDWNSDDVVDGADQDMAFQE